VTAKRNSPPVTTTGGAKSAPDNRHDLLAHTIDRQSALRRQPTPSEELIGLNAVLARHEADGDAKLVGFFDNRQILGGRLPAAALRLPQAGGRSRQT
jgi:hypothetical protein